MKYIDFFLKHNWIAIFYFNFKMLPFKQAIHLPFDFYNKVKFRDLSGNVVLSVNKIKKGMIKIGAQGSEMFPPSYSILDIRGKLTINGKFSLGSNSLIRIERKGEIIIDEDVTIGAYNKIICEESIIIGKGTITSWECQIMDTDTHSTIDLETQKILIRHKPIMIGKNNWISNNVIINKGTITPDDTIVASCSLCNKDYSKIINKYSIIGGIPAKILGTNKAKHNDKIN